jgi:Dimethyladenosine transferase (rRNA methylation)
MKIQFMRGIQLNLLENYNMKKLLFKITNKLRFIYSKFYNKYIILDYRNKRKLIKKFKRKNKSDLFIETGTFLGDTIESLRSEFKKLISIELSESLALKCKNRFKSYNHITIIQGDSGILLKEVLKEIEEPCLFWLDGHYSSEFYLNDEFIRTAKGEKETPILMELETILTHPIKNHIILIDDARCFNGKGDYPNIREIKTLIKKYGHSLQIKISRDIIRIFPYK